MCQDKKSGYFQHKNITRRLNVVHQLGLKRPGSVQLDGTSSKNLNATLESILEHRSLLVDCFFIEKHFVDFKGPTFND